MVNKHIAQKHNLIADIKSVTTAEASLWYHPATSEQIELGSQPPRLSCLSGICIFPTICYAGMKKDCMQGE